MQRETRGKSRCDTGLASPSTDQTGFFFLLTFFLCFCFFLYIDIVHLFCVLKVHLCFQGCVSVQNEETLLLKAPKESQNMKTAERGITQSMHKFSFTKVGAGGWITVWCIVQVHSFTKYFYFSLSWPQLDIYLKNVVFLLPFIDLSTRDYTATVLWQHHEKNGQGRASGGKQTPVHLWRHQFWKDLHRSRWDSLVLPVHTCCPQTVETVLAAQQIWHCDTTGSGREAGLLPRALASLFKKVQGRLYEAMDLKPVMYQDVRHLSKGEVKVEEFRKNSLLKEVWRKSLIIFTCAKRQFQGWQ